MKHAVEELRCLSTRNPRSIRVLPAHYPRPLQVPSACAVVKKDPKHDFVIIDATIIVVIDDDKAGHV